jgi:hypothetical protein
MNVPKAIMHGHGAASIAGRRCSSSCASASSMIHWTKRETREQEGCVVPEKEKICSSTNERYTWTFSATVKASGYRIIRGIRDAQRGSWWRCKREMRVRTLRFTPDEW